MRQLDLPIKLTRIPFCGAVLLLAACHTAPPPAETPVAHVDPASAASVSGRVLFTGKAPKRVALDMSATPACERQHKTPAFSEQVVVNPNRTLANTFVWVKKGLPDARWPVPSEPAKLDQQGCIYVPHVLGVMTGQPVEFDNSDPMNHNVHAEAVTNASWNHSQPPRAEKIVRTFEKQEILFPVTCGVHPWMRAYIGVVDHPFFAVTGADGSFQLKGLPPGTYILEAVHEIYGHRELTVTLGPKEQKDVQFTYAGD